MYIGRQISNLSDRVKLDAITTSATATYNLLLNSVAYVPSSAESLTVSLNGVIQAPQDSYTVSGSTITFSSTLSAQDSIDFILAERSITLQTPSAGSVGLTQLSATGTKDATTFLRGDNTFASASVDGISSSSSSTAISIDSNGHVTMPLQPCFFVYKSVNQTLGTGTADITFDTERFDLNADFSSNTFTAPVTGKYSFQAIVGYVNAQAGGNVSVYLEASNASIRAFRNDSGSDDSVYESASISAVIDMDANDTCKLRFNSSTDNDFFVESSTYRTYFSGHLVA